jgi:hypothetical protein
MKTILQKAANAGLLGIAGKLLVSDKDKDKEKKAMGAVTPAATTPAATMKKGGKVPSYRDGGIYTADMGKPPQDIDGGSAPPKKPAAKKPAAKKPAAKKPAVKFAKGGSVRGYGSARGGKSCKMV